MGIKYQDYYQTLGMPKTASQAEIKGAYRKLARQYHPDVNKDKSAAEKFGEIGEAYEVLKDPEKRKKYDTLGANWKAGQDFTPPPGWEKAQFEFGGSRGAGPGGQRFSGDLGGEFTDFFEMFFGGQGGPGGPAGSGPGQMGFDIRNGSRIDTGQTHEAALTISLEDAYHGTTKQITLQGAPSHAGKTLSVKIPPGTTNGSTIRLAGQGGPSHGGGRQGDLLLRITIAPHQHIQVHGHNLHTSLSLTPWEAALGAKVPVRTLDGQVSLTIPAGTQSGQKLRLRGKGLPQRNQPEQRGDLFIQIKIVVPDPLTDEERQLFESLAEQSGFDPRSQGQADDPADRSAD